MLTSLLAKLMHSFSIFSELNQLSRYLNQDSKARSRMGWLAHLLLGLW